MQVTVWFENRVASELLAMASEKGVIIGDVVAELLMHHKAVVS